MLYLKLQNNHISDGPRQIDQSHGPIRCRVEIPFPYMLAVCNDMHALTWLPRGDEGAHVKPKSITLSSVNGKF